MAPKRWAKGQADDAQAKETSLLVNPTGRPGIEALVRRGVISAGQAAAVREALWTGRPETGGRGPSDPEVKMRGLSLMTHRTVARLCDLDTETLRKWVAAGLWPEPHSVIRQTWFYPTDAIHQYLRYGTWPEGVRFKRGRGRGRVIEDGEG